MKVISKYRYTSSPVIVQGFKPKRDDRVRLVLDYKIEDELNIFESIKKHEKKEE